MKQTEQKVQNIQDPACSNDEEKVYVLEGEPDEVFDAEGNRIKLTKEQEEEIEKQIG